MKLNNIDLFDYYVWYAFDIHIHNVNQNKKYFHLNSHPSLYLFNLSDLFEKFLDPFWIGSVLKHLCLWPGWIYHMYILSVFVKFISK